MKALKVVVFFFSVWGSFWVGVRSSVTCGCAVVANLSDENIAVCGRVYRSLTE